MILDAGVCTIFAKVNHADPGGMPSYSYERKHQAWYGLIDFETSPANPTEGRTERQTSARIRILQKRDLHEDDVVILAEVEKVEGNDRPYKITRAYHGRDDDNGEAITDLTLEEVSPWN